MPTAYTKVTMTYVTPAGATVTRTYHAAGAITISTDGKTKSFTGKRDGETVDGALVIQLHPVGLDLLDQKEEAE